MDIDIYVTRGRRVPAADAFAERKDYPSFCLRGQGDVTRCVAPAPVPQIAQDEGDSIGRHAPVLRDPVEGLHPAAFAIAGADRK